MLLNRFSMGEKTRLDMKIDTARPQLIDSQWVTLNCLPPVIIPKMGKLFQSENIIKVAKVHSWKLVG